MTLNASLRSRVRRLESAAACATTPGRAEVMRLARAKRLAMSASELAAWHAQCDARALASLTEPNAIDGTQRKVQEMRRRRARRLLAEVRS